MISDATESQSAVARINGLVGDLAKSDLAVYGIAYDYLHFGSWTMEVGRRHHRVLLQWDGKESLLTVSVAMVPNAQARKEWKRAAEMPISPPSGGGKDLFAIARDLAVKHSAA